jgi:uroporphyrinogen-III decarboxylase
MVADTIKILGKGGGYIIAAAQEIMNDVPIENVKAVVETIKEEREKVLNI